MAEDAEEPTLSDISDKLGMPWDQMTLQQRRLAWDIIDREMQILSRTIALEFNALLERSKAPIRIDVSINMSPTDNRQDPRLGEPS